MTEALAIGLLPLVITLVCFLIDRRQFYRRQRRAEAIRREAADNEKFSRWPPAAGSWRDPNISCERIATNDQRRSDQLQPRGPSPAGRAPRAAAGAALTIRPTVRRCVFRQADEADELKRIQLSMVSLMGTLAETRKAGDEKLNALIDAQQRTEAHLEQFILEVRRMIGERNGGARCQ